MSPLDFSGFEPAEPQAPAGAAPALDFSQFEEAPEFAATPEADIAFPGPPAVDLQPPVDPNAPVHPDVILPPDYQATAPVAENLPERLESAGGALAQGAAGIFAAMPKSIAIAQSQAHRDVQKSLDMIDKGETPVTAKDYPMAHSATIFRYRLATPEQRLRIRAEFGFTPDPRESQFYKAGVSLEKAAAEAFPIHPEFRKDFWTTKVPMGAGSAAAFIGVSVLGRTFRMPPLASAGTLGAAAGGAAGFEDALRKNATLEDAFRSANFNALVGTSEALPVADFLARLDRATGGGIKRGLTQMLLQGTEEAAQEFFQAVMENIIASDIVKYDPKRQTFTGTGEDAAAGFTVGALYQFIGNIFGGRRRGGAGPPPVAPLPPGEMPVPQMETGAPAGALPAEQIIGKDLDFSGFEAAPEAAITPPSLAEAAPQAVEAPAPTPTPPEAVEAPVEQPAREEPTLQAAVLDRSADLDARKKEREAAHEAIQVAAIDKGLDTQGAEVQGLFDTYDAAKAAEAEADQAWIDAIRRRDASERPTREEAAQIEPITAAPPPAPPPEAPAAVPPPTVRVRGRPRRLPTGKVDVLTFLAAREGIRDDEGHALRTSRDAQRFIPGQGSLIRPSGVSIDRAGEMLHEAGYFGPPATTERPTEADVLDMLERAFQGEKVYTSEYEAEAVPAEAEFEAENDRQIRAAASDLGIELTDTELTAVKEALADGLDIEDAVEAAVIQTDMLAGDEVIEAAPETEDIPFEERPDEEIPRAPREQGEVAPQGEPEPEGAAARPPRGVPGGEEPGRPGEAREVEPAGPKKTLFASRPVTNATDIVDWAREQGFKTTLVPEDMHVTVAHSSAALAWDAAGDTAPAARIEGGKRTVEALGDNGAVVLRFESSALQERWQQYRDAGASWDFEGYKPHITITYEGGDVDLSKVTPYAGPILFGVERQETVDDDAVSKVEEVPTGAIVSRETLPTEPTAQGEQAVIPGAERITEREEAEREMEAPLRPRARQETEAEGLFDTGARRQTDIFDQPPAVPAPPEPPTAPPAAEVPVTPETAAPPVTGQPGTQEADEDERFSLSPELTAKRETVTAGIRKAFDDIGLTQVGVTVSERIDRLVDGEMASADARYLHGAVDVALSGPDPQRASRHEAIHAMRDYGLFSEAEWKLLTTASDKMWRQQYDIDTRYSRWPEDVKTEEGIADAWSDWQAGNLKTGGLLKRAFEKIKQFLEALGNALRGRGFQTVDDVFGRVERGEVGARERGAVAGAERFAAAYHGTPHEFEQFDTGKIGTGEGAQAYGWGLYFSGRKTVAQHYRESLSGPTGKIEIDGEQHHPGNLADDLWGEVKDKTIPNDPLYKFDEISAVYSGWLQKFYQMADHGEKEWQNIRHGPDADHFDIGYTEAVRVLKTHNAKQAKPGRLLKVDLTPEEDEYLLWDKPLSDQSEKVRVALNSFTEVRGLVESAEKGSLTATGEAAYLLLADEYGRRPHPKGWYKTPGFRDAQAASLALRDAGIPGIKYLDQGSRGPRDNRFQVSGGQQPQAFATRAEAEAHVGEFGGTVNDAGEGTYNYVIFDAEQVEITERFSLSEDTPDTAENRQKAAQGAIAKGQPLDRALRIPFDWFGGVDAKGEWKPGRKMFDKAADRIVNAKFSPTGPFSWINGPLEAARHGLIDRYGLSVEYTRRERRLGLDKREIATEGAEILQRLARQGVSFDEAKVLQAVLTGEAVADADMAKLALPIRQAIDEYGQEYVSLGMVSPESYERNRGSYLHRVYMKHEQDQPRLSRWYTAHMTKKRKKIIGDAFKGRGMFLEVDQRRVMRDIPSFWEGRRGGPVKGEKYIVLDKIAEQGELEGIETGIPKIERRVYWPAGEAVPDKYADYTDHGTWEVRNEPGKGRKLILWRDYSKAERESMGEITDARYTIARTFMLMSNDLATGRFYKDVADNEDWARTDQPGGRWVESSEFRRIWFDDTVEWVRVPETAIPQTGGKKRWGALSGMWVRPEIWRDLNEIDTMSGANFWTEMLTVWKLSKTARSPVVHMNNIMSNFVFMDLADVRLQDLVHGIRAYATSSADYQEAAAHGAFGADLISQEVRREILEPLLDEIEREMSGTNNPAMTRFGVLGRMAEAVWSRGKKIDRKMVDLYRLEDEVFRMGMYMRRRSLGESAEDAALEARQQFLDYDIRAPWVNMARRSVLPFIAYSYRAAPLIARSVATRPWKLAKYFMLAYAANAMSYMIAPGDEDEERRSISDRERGYTWIGVPRMMRMPYRDAHGNPVFLDIRRWIPAGDVFDISQGHGAFSLPAPLGFGGPIMMAGELLFNESAFTGDDIVNRLTDTPMERAGKIGDFLWKSWMPSAAWVPGSWYWRKIGLAIDGGLDSRGRPYPVPEAVASSFGIKLKPQDVEANFAWRVREYDKERRALNFEAKRLDRLRSRNIISDESHREGLGAIRDKNRRIDARERETFKKK